MDNRLTILCRDRGVKGGRFCDDQPLSGMRCKGSELRNRAGKTVRGGKLLKAGLRARSGQSGGQEKPLSDETIMTVPQTDTGRQVEKTKANGRTLVKELGKQAA